LKAVNFFQCISHEKSPKKDKKSADSIRVEFIAKNFTAARARESVTGGETKQQY